MTLVAKIGLLGVAGGGGIGGAVGSVYYIKNRKDNSIKTRFSEVSDKLLFSDPRYVGLQAVGEMIFAEYKHDEEFLNSMQETENYYDVRNFSDPLLGAVFVGTWCYEKLKLDLTEENKRILVPKIEKYCTLPSKTFEERANKFGKKLVTDWDSRFRKIKETRFDSESVKRISTRLNSLDIEIKKEVNSFTDLNNWCNENTKREITHYLRDFENNNLWNLILSRCYE